MSPRDPFDEDDLLEEAWDALEDGEPAYCLSLLERCHPEEPARALIAVRAYLDLGERVPAHAELQRALKLGVPKQDPDWLAAAGELALAEWEIERAERCFTLLQGEEPSAYACERLALLADLREDLAAADRWMAEACRLDPEHPPLARLSGEELDQVIESAIAELSPQHKGVLETTPVLVQAMPHRELAPPEDPLSVPPDALGLFVGPDLVDEAETAWNELPPAIYIFQRNLERMCATRDELIEEIGTTLYHELGHRLGYDEEGVEDLGLG